MKCPECDGKPCVYEDRDIGKRWHYCPACGGTGDARPSHGDWIPAKRRMRPCEQCRGSGFVEEAVGEEEPR